jgi:hypothetical protein
MENAKIIFLDFYMSMRHFLSNLVKYIVEGLVVAVVAYYIPERNTDLKTVAMIGLIAALTFALLDYFSPSIGASSRLGAGFGIGSNLVGFGGGQGIPRVSSLPTLSGPAVNTVSGGTYEGFYEDPANPETYAPNEAVVHDALGNQVVVNTYPAVSTVQTLVGVPGYETAQYGTGYPYPTPSQAAMSLQEETGQ